MSPQLIEFYAVFAAFMTVMFIPEIYRLAKYLFTKKGN